MEYKCLAARLPLWRCPEFSEPLKICKRSSQMVLLSLRNNRRELVCACAMSMYKSEVQKRHKNAHLWQPRQKCT
ncbi:hypothetical protein XELAEV_18011780mg [Xenopus laevis]|uniref:Uncharacterized protein n=1 Tax=Xenopus laevis TaxID=8355 RepID=A0A974HXS4_XENLA|nr:hypothetical protein XELAEV_18011780mg [Xenopus laevis]